MFVKTKTKMLWSMESKWKKKLGRLEPGS